MHSRRQWRQQRSWAIIVVGLLMREEYLGVRGVDNWFDTGTLSKSSGYIVDNWSERWLLTFLRTMRARQ
jgi:hypothetical protein